jgi:hypothetical protein
MDGPGTYDGLSSTEGFGCAPGGWCWMITGGGV